MWYGFVIQERKFISQTDIRKELQELEEKSAESDGIADAPLPEHRPAQHHLTVDIQVGKLFTARF